MILSVIFLCGLYGLSQAHESRYCLTAEERLYHDLLDGYAPHMRNTRPVSRHNETMNVKVGMSLININSFDQSTGVGEFLFWDKFSWTDSRLTWDPAHYDGLQAIRLPVNQIWQPDITDYRSLWSREADHVGEFMANAYSSGLVYYIPIHIRKLKCKELQKAIADDEFECLFKIGSWTYSKDLLELDFFDGEKKMDIDDFMGDPGHIVANSAESHDKKYPCCEESYQDLRFTLTFLDDAV